MFKALRDQRVAEEEHAATYDRLLSDIKQLWGETESLRQPYQQVAEFGYIKEAIGFQLIRQGVDGKEHFTLKVVKAGGLPGVSFLGGKVDWMVYKLPLMLEKASVSGHRSDTDEEVTVDPKNDQVSFWSEIEALQKSGIKFMREIIK